MIIINLVVAVLSFAIGYLFGSMQKTKKVNIKRNYQARGEGIGGGVPNHPRPPRHEK